MKLSPTSINTLFGCPRRFWLKYIEKLPEAFSIHLVKGIAVHHSLEMIFKDKIHKDMDLREHLLKRGEHYYRDRWTVDKLKLTPDEKAQHFIDGLTMIKAFINRTVDQIEMLIQSGKAGDVYHAMNLVKPKFTEIRYTDTELKVGGSIDQVLTDFDGNVVLLDLKTSNKFRNNLPEDYERQLAIYAYLYFMNEKKIPKWVCINYLRYGESFYIRINNSYIQWAISEIIRAREFLQVNGQKINYFKKESALCPYCSYCDLCAKEKQEPVIIPEKTTEKKIDEFKLKINEDLKKFS